MEVSVRTEVAKYSNSTEKQRKSIWREKSNDQCEGKSRQAKTVQKRAEEIEMAKRNNN
jgi:hypothetical protein